MEFRYNSDTPFQLGEWFKIERNHFWHVYLDSRIKIRDDKGAVAVVDERTLRDLVEKSLMLNGDPALFDSVWITLNNIKPVAIDSKDIVSESATLNYNYRVVLQPPAIKKAHPLELGMLTEDFEYKRNIWCYPLVDLEKKALDQALEYTGFKKKMNLSHFVACKSSTISTCFLQKSSDSIDKRIMLILNFNQIQGLCSGAITSAIIAQIVTHELAHYLMFDGILRQSQSERYKQALVARRLHPDQFHHAGYTYPWYHEAWATLCEYMVHGSSARGLSCTEGWELAEQYFDNNFLINGNPTGDRLIKI
jgi:hypothetical protein